jgi:hypothetical protein
MPGTRAWTPHFFEQDQQEAALAFVEVLDITEYVITAPAAIECVLVYGSTTELPRMESL